ncbi:MAG: hypothetical protein V7607_3257 [Solirubrobacteraceae bacterium]
MRGRVRSTAACATLRAVKLLEAEPVVAPEVAPEAPRESPQEQPPSKPEAVRTCASCGSPMEPDQDWCLNCGAAASGTLGQRPGWRAASTVIALTLVLVLGAIAASYAAITDHGKKPAPPAPAQQQAQATPPPAATPPAASTPTQSTPTQSTPTTPNKLPKVKTPKSNGTGAVPITPTTSTPTTSTPTTSTPTTSTPTTSTPSTTTPQQPAGPQPIKLAADAGKAYDPYGKSKASGDAQRAIDDDTATSWYVDLKDPAQLGLGYAIDLGKLQGIREIQLQTPTPGFRVEIYATDETDLPPDILDTRWSHITNVSDVGTKDNGTQKIVLGAGTTKYRNLLLWFTKAPTDGSRIRLTEVKPLG